MPLSSPRSPWPLVWLLYLSGLLAAAQLGKLSVLAPSIAADLGLSLVTVALAVSLLELGGAALGTVAALLAQHLGLRRVLRLSMLALVLGGLGGGRVEGAAGLLGWRLLEAAGYLGVMVSAPVMIARHTGHAGQRAQGLAMTLWSTFVPAGLALGAWASGSVASWLGWRAAIAGSAGVCAVLWLVLCRADLPADPAPTAGQAEAAVPARTALTPATLCLAFAFGGFALFDVGVLGMLPTLLVHEVGLAVPAAGRWTALAAVSSVAGSALAALLLRRGTAPRVPLLLALALPPCLLFGVFTRAPSAAAATLLPLLVNVLCGLYASLSFALLPRLASGPGQMVRANGLLLQCGASGSLLGPPLMAVCVQAGGWTAAAALAACVSALALPLAWVASGRDALGLARSS